MMPVPVDVAGELYLGGVGLARGYLDRPVETSERFVQWSYGEHPAQRLYRTGDMARFSPDGLIEILGRKDFQVKINGMRVELGEIESTIAAHPGVRRAVVVSRVAPNGHTSLAAYVTAEPALTPDYASVLDSLHARLPKHMIPSSIEIVESLPLNGNGKVDRLALSSPTKECVPAPREPAEPAEPGGPAEPAEPDRSAGPGGPADDGKWYRLVIDAWLDVLGVDHLEGHDNFFEHGGDSMKAIRGMVRIDRRLRLSDIYEHPTATALVAHLTAVYGECPSSPS